MQPQNELTTESFALAETIAREPGGVWALAIIASLVLCGLMTIIAFRFAAKRAAFGGNGEQIIALERSIEARLTAHDKSNQADFERIDANFKKLAGDFASFRRDFSKESITSTATAAAVAAAAAIRNQE